MTTERIIAIIEEHQSDQYDRSDSAADKTHALAYDHAAFILGRVIDSIIAEENTEERE